MDSEANAVFIIKCVQEANCASLEEAWSQTHRETPLLKERKLSAQSSLLFSCILFLES